MIREISLEQIEPYLDLIAEIEHTKLDRKNVSHERWLRNRIKSFEARGALFFVYEDLLHNEISGVVTVLHEHAPEGIEALDARAEILQIGVTGNGRRKGIGSLLLKHAEQFVRSRGAYCLFMMTYAEDYDVIAFYGKNGFVPVATLPDVYGPTLEGNVFLRKVLR
jgi:GNAT superfamily N-acetyltransferase